MLNVAVCGFVSVPLRHADARPNGSLAGLPRRNSGPMQTKASGAHSRAAFDSGIVWNRETLRRSVSDPPRVISGTLMSVSVPDPADVDGLVADLESLR
jgi:cytochrome c2